jgi:hypothetical protein
MNTQGLQGADSDLCTAWADAHDSLHPGNPSLLWHVFEGSRGQHLPDDQLRALVAPSTIEVVFQQPEKRVDGTYNLVGLHEGRPAYAKEETSHVIRYHPMSNRWLIDIGCFRATAECIAFADAQDFSHPGSPSLTWHVWNAQQRSHAKDETLRTLTAPAAVEVSGLEARLANCCINGTYDLVGLHKGKVAYAKAGTQHVIRYWPQWDRWLVDIEGFRDCNSAAAFADTSGTEHPGDIALEWNVWDSSHGQHVLDPNMVVRETTRKSFALVPSYRANASDQMPLTKVARVSAHGHAAQLQQQLCPLDKENHGGRLWTGVKSLGNGVKSGLRNLLPGRSRTDPQRSSFAQGCQSKRRHSEM